MLWRAPHRLHGHPVGDHCFKNPLHGFIPKLMLVLLLFQVLVAPVTEKTALRRDIYLPVSDFQWQDTKNAQVFDGGTFLESYPVGLGDVPVFVRRRSWGLIIPFSYHFTSAIALSTKTIICVSSFVLLIMSFLALSLERCGLHLINSYGLPHFHGFQLSWPGAGTRTLFFLTQSVEFYDEDDQTIGKNAKSYQQI